ncbi:hypothetical protein P7C73_g2907, partial [Tremellales sp. Uapishka_1]
ANSHSEATSQALLEELNASQPALLQGLSKRFPDMMPKAYRWVGEMEEIASFIDTSLLGGASDPEPEDISPERNVADTYRGLALMFQRLADSVAEKEAGNQDVAALTRFTDEAKRLVSGQK